LKGNKLDGLEDSTLGGVTSGDVQGDGDGSKTTSVDRCERALCLIFIRMLIITRSVVVRQRVIAEQVLLSLASRSGCQVLIWQPPDRHELTDGARDLSVTSCSPVGADYNLLLGRGSKRRPTAVA